MELIHSNNKKRKKKCDLWRQFYCCCFLKQCRGHPWVTFTHFQKTQIGNWLKTHFPHEIDCFSFICIVSLPHIVTVHLPICAKLDDFLNLSILTLPSSQMSMDMINWSLTIKLSNWQSSFDYIWTMFLF